MEVEIEEIEFQFLIGTLKTRIYKQTQSGIMIVSIPHRYAENGAPLPQVQCLSSVSITHRYAENHVVRTMPAFYCAVSIPHRYAENSFSSLLFAPLPPVSIPHRYAENVGLSKKLIRSYPVSIPHRYAENFINVISRKRGLAWFQFLIGTLKTVVGGPSSI